ncbi:MAG: hypothetical protein H6838_08420 [Planctomycetes bacterium]|nr:hypothetical protein [Planctomycetota bacterium]MCB9885502.1 hypothetical protein [Planctomycetota bacterium]
MSLAFRSLFLALAVSAPLAAQEGEKKFEITPEIQTQIDSYKKEIATWAADAKVVAAVIDQNKKGPIAGMDNKKWKTLRRRSEEVTVFQTNDAAKALQAKAKATNGIASEAFLNAAKGEKVAFLEKTSSYLHDKSGKFTTPFTKKTAWQGEPEFDESSQTYAVQISVPVFDTADKEKKTPIGVLVVGLNLTQLAQPKPAPGK